MISLYQFKFSHYCEKVSWALDYKEISHKCNNLLPGPHIKTLKKLQCKSLPIITDNKQIILQGSDAIIDYLDKTYTDRQLTPANEQQADEAKQWENFFDQDIGIPIRLWFYFHLLKDRDLSMNFMLQGSSWFQRLFFPFIFDRIQTGMYRILRINAKTAEVAKIKFLNALDTLEQTLEQQNYLVGGQFSRADLSACALLSPFCALDMSEQKIKALFPEEVWQLRESHKSRPYFKWVTRIYQQYRQH